MSQRLSGLSHEEATGTTKLVYEASDRFLGRTANLQRILATHSPYIARWFGGWSPPSGSPTWAPPPTPACAGWPASRHP